jgi:hypothetical protein
MEEEHVSDSRRPDAQAATPTNSHEHAASQRLRVRLGLGYADGRKQRDDGAQEQYRPAPDAVADRDPKEGGDGIQDGGSRADVCRLGCRRVELGRQGVRARGLYDFMLRYCTFQG